MYDFNVEVLSYDQDSGEYIVRYCIDKGSGVVRRAKAVYKNNKLSRDYDNLVLLKEVKLQASLFEREHK